MASFFQPGSNDPAIAACPPSTFEVYCNSILPADQRFRKWYQLVTLIVGGVTLAVPLGVYLCQLGVLLCKSAIRSSTRRRKHGKDAPKDGENTDRSAPLFKPTKSFRVYTESDGLSKHGASREYDLLVLPLTISGGGAGREGASLSSALTVTTIPSKMTLACVDIESLGPEALADANIPYTAAMLVETEARHSLSGLALRCSTAKNPKQVDRLMERLYSDKVPVLILCQHDSDVLDSLSFEHASGVIIESACILPTGERRDYFISRRLRDTMARCAKEREERPDFFVGFLDLWEKRPHPSVIRRAVKLAEHFGAVIEHGPVSFGTELGLGNNTVKSASESVGGFEYLRRSESTELQKSWMSEIRTVWVPNGSSSPEMAPLPLRDLVTVIPQVFELFKQEELAPELDAIRTAVPDVSIPPNYVDLAPARTNFWEQSGEGQELSPSGCFPLTTEPSLVHYNAVVDTQRHLKELDMLNPVKGDDAYRILEALQTLVDSATCDELVQDLIAGLSSHQVCIFKGLDTGFGVPEGDVYFWGVSRSRDERTKSAVDIFISQKAPHDATTVLHTWLAHHGVPRVRRFELELALETANRIVDKSIIPLSIKAAMERASNSETLYLLQQLRVSRVDHQFSDNITAFGRSLLIETTSKNCWKALCASKVLNGSLNMRDLIQTRLEEFVRRGATTLPTLDNLVKLHEVVEQAVCDGLFFGDRDILNVMTDALLQSFDPWMSWTRCDYVDINADLFALIFFSVLRKAAFEDVYIEATDRCPLYLSQPDQAAVFSELWVLGSQCEIYFGLLPRQLGGIVYNRYRNFLERRPPTASDRKGNEIMSMYASSDVKPPSDADPESSRDGSAPARLTPHEIGRLWKKRFTNFGAMSIFCLPAIIDVVLLTFVGRGMFMTAFMDPDHLQAAGYALLIALLLTAGVTGWVGSTGNYYLAHYAYDNMIFFHVQRLSGGFVLTFLVALGGLVGFALQYSIAVGFIFAAYVIVITTYLNLLGIMATMHQHQSPITSGRTVLWRTIPFLLISPVLSSLVNGYDIAIYLPVTYTFLVLTLFQYRRLCHEWSGWLQNIPKFAEKDVVEWYSAKLGPQSSDDERAESQGKVAQEAFREAVAAYNRGRRSSGDHGAFVGSVARGMPYVDWLFKKVCPNGEIPDAFSTSWFTQLGEATKQQQQLSRGLKEHNGLMLFRAARYDMGQNLGLFLVALMDRWVSIVMGARLPHVSMYTDSRARYGICLCILYFCFSVMLLDTTLSNYWSIRFKLSTEKLVDHEHAQRVANEWETKRLKTFGKALAQLFAKISIVFGGATILLWVLVESPETMVFYYCYTLGYTCVIIFQFNRCFTTNVRAHVTIILSSAAVGLVVGCVLHAAPSTAGWLYSDVVAQNSAAVLAALGTSLWSWRDWSAPRKSEVTEVENDYEPNVWLQRKICADSSVETEMPSSQMRGIVGTTVKCGDGSFVSEKVSQFLKDALDNPNGTAKSALWSKKLLQEASSLWSRRKIHVVVVGREQFSRAGLEDVWSFSQFNAGTLEITAGFVENSELRLPSWQNLLANLVAESVVYHCSRAGLKLSHAQAIQAEHFLLPETNAVSTRIDFELSLEQESMILLFSRRTNLELMRHLCLGLAVDSQWEAIPRAGRQAILNRITLDPVATSEEFSQWISESCVDVQTVDFHVNLTLLIFQKSRERIKAMCHFPSQGVSPINRPPDLIPVCINRTRAPVSLLQHWLRVAATIPLAFVKWTSVISGGVSDIERELWYSLQGLYFRNYILRILLGLWRLCWHLRNLWLYALLVYHRPSLVSITRLAQKGTRRKIVNNSVIVEFPRKTVTGFTSNDDAGSMVLEVFDGLIKEAPEGKSPMFTALYDEKFRLKSRLDNDTITSTYHYSPTGRQRWPLSKEVVHDDFRTVGFYDKYGRIARGTLTLRNAEFAFQYHYKASPKGNADVLRADFKQIEPGSDNMLSVFWGVPLRNDFDVYNWVPSEKICRIIKVVDGKTYITEAEYQHKRDPFITTFFEEENGQKTAIAKPPRAFADEALLLARPNNLSFDSDDLLIYHKLFQIKNLRSHSLNRHPLSRLLFTSWLTWWGKRVYRPVPTWRIRTELWTIWLKTGNLDAVTACWIDELVLREEPLLRDYWRARDKGHLHEAKAALDQSIDQVVSAIEIETDVSEVCLLPIRTTDLYTMGLGKDATQVTSRPEDCYRDTAERISVIFNDIGCWPEAPGGVSNCRRDLVNGHSTIRNHVLAECANDFGIPRFQIEKNVQSLKLLPLWGLDGKNAHHGLIDNLLQSQVDEKVRDTDVQRDIVGIFVPLLKDFVKGARTRRYSRADLIKYSNVMLSMSKYYEHKDYSRTWESKAVEDAWVEAWLTPYNDPSIMDPTKCFDIERPSMSDFREALAIYLAYFFIFSVKIPDECPRVFQSTHHGISSLFGMILKYRRGVTFGIWDHAILWRECCLNISPAQCELPISVQSMLLSGIGLATRLAYFHADVVMPCTSLFNPMWESEIGTDQGQLGSKNRFDRKIDPIVNGISNMDSFTPVDRVRTDKPTVVMLSNVQFIKGIKTAILAADIIVNRYGFKDYQLLVYGAKDRQPSYALEMAKLIVENNLSDRVILAGFGKPKEVLKDAWLFMNSSISEGLPLAIGEAALAGVPIVATEVGATALVLTDPEDPDQRYGEVVPPNDPLALANAQLSILGMLGPWAKFTADAGQEPEGTATLPDSITPDVVEWLTRRMYEKSEDRRKLGLLSRQVVLHSFHGKRYLREHEQMYWIQWHLAKLREDEALKAASRDIFKFGSLPPLRYAEHGDDVEEIGSETGEAAEKDRAKAKVAERWQDFGSDEEEETEKPQRKRLSKQRVTVTEVPV